MFYSQAKDASKTTSLFKTEDKEKGSGNSRLSAFQIETEQVPDGQTRAAQMGGKDRDEALSKLETKNKDCLGLQEQIDNIDLKNVETKVGELRQM